MIGNSSISIGVILRKVLQPFLPKTLFARSFLIIMTPVLLTVSISAFVFFDRHWSTTTERLIISYAGEVAYISEQVESALNKQNRNALQEIVKNANRNLGIIVAIHDGQMRLDENARRLSKSFLVETKLQQALEEKLNYPFYVLITTDDRLITRIQLGASNIEIMSARKRIFSTTTYVLLASMIGAGLFLLAIATIFMRNQIRPLRRLAQAAEEFGKGNDVQSRFRPAGATEVRQAAQAFLVMRERIKRQIQQRTEMLAGVSHDLRTPLTRMKLQLEMMDQSSEDVIELQKDLQNMVSMIDAYLAFAHGNDQHNVEDVNIVSFIQSYVERHISEHIILELNGIESEIVLKIDPNAIERVFNNVVSNALKYASQCTISINDLPAAIEIQFEDDGPGINRDAYEDVFKPFMRLDEARNLDEAGVGLGLSIARDIVRRHGGDVRLAESQAYGGLKLIVRLPK